MKNFFAKVISFMKTKTEYVVLGLLVVVFGVLCIVGGGTLANPSTFYQTGEVDASKYVSAVVYKIDLSNGENVTGAWINIGGKDYSTTNDITVRSSLAKDENTAFPTGIASKTVTNTVADAQIGQWVKLFELSSGSAYRTYPILMITTTSTIKINEIAVTGVKDDVTYRLNLQCIASGQKESAKWDRSFASSTELDKSETGIKNGSVLVDEQNKFDVSKVNYSVYNNDAKSKFTETECYTLESIRNLTTGKGNFVDQSANPLATYLMAFGTLIFGQNTFGLRFMPFLFSLGMIVLLFFVGQLVFNKKWLGVILAGLFTMCGYAFGLATLGRADMIFAFFILLAFTLLFKFYKKGISNKHPVPSYISLLIGGASFAVAFSIKAQAVFFAPLMLLIAVLGFIRQYKAYKFRAYKLEGDKVAVAENKKAYIKKLSFSLLTVILGLVVLTVGLLFLVYGTAYTTYSKVYSSTGYFYCMNKGLSNAFTTINQTSFNSVNAVSPLGWIINLGAEKISDNKFIFGNIIIVFINLFSLIYGGCFVLMKLVDGSGKLDNDIKSKFVMPYCFSALGLICGWLFYLITGGVQSFFIISTVFGLIVTVTVFNTLDSEENRLLFKIGKFDVSVLRFIMGVIFIMVVACGCMSIPALCGAKCSSWLFAWNILQSGTFI